jgi:hypothetical protein
MAFSVETALCIVVPESLTSWIQQCRSQHDRAYKRWPPHIKYEDLGSTLSDLFPTFSLVQSALGPRFHFKMLTNDRV